MEGNDDGPKEYEAADFVPDEFDAVPSYASSDTKWLYFLAVVVQIGQIVVTTWGLNRLSKPELPAWDKILAGVVSLAAIVVFIRVWSAAYHSAAEDRHRDKPWLRDRPW